MKKKITLKYIARELEVSISTVSKALKNSPEIGKETKEKIQAYAKKYNFRPNNIAISLKNSRTKNIAVIIPNIVHYFFTTTIRGMEKYANKLGYNLIICLSNESYDKEVANMEMLANGSIDGFIISLASETQLKHNFEHLKKIKEEGLPIVMFDRVAYELECDKVVIDDERGAYLAVRKFIEGGCKNIAFITTKTYLSVSKDRMRGYKKALEDHGIGYQQNLVLELPSIKIDEQLIGNFLKEQKIDAVLSVNEIFAIHSMGLVQERGVSIPKDISFIGFTDGILSRYANPGLTSVAQYGEKMGETAAKILIEKIESTNEEETYKTYVLKPKLIERASTFK